MKKGSRKTIAIKRELIECATAGWGWLRETSLPLATSKHYHALEFAFDGTKATIYVAAYRRILYAPDAERYARLKAILKRYFHEIAASTYTYLNFAQVEQAHDLLFWQKAEDQWFAEQRARTKGVAPQLSLFGGED